MDAELVICSIRSRPDLAPVYRLFEETTGIPVRVARSRREGLLGRLVAERADPPPDLLVSNSRLLLESWREAGIFAPYAPALSRVGDPELRAPDFGWVSFSVWPRVAMVNRQVLPDPAGWPRSVEDLRDPRFADLLSCAGPAEMATIAQFAGLRVVWGDDRVERLLAGLLANRIRIRPSNLAVREAVVNDGLAVGLADSSNVHVSCLAGHPVAEAWLDQEEGGAGATFDTHCTAILAAARHPEAARDFTDFLLGKEVQDLLARLYGETPVNPSAGCCHVRPLSEIRRTAAGLSQLVALMDSTREMLAGHHFAVTTASSRSGDRG